MTTTTIITLIKPGESVLECQTILLQQQITDCAEVL